MPNYSAGTYQIEVTRGEGSAAKTFRQYVEIKDSTPKAVITEVIKSDFNSALTDKVDLAKAAIAECLKISYPGQDSKSYSVSEIFVKDGDVQKTTTKNNVHVKTAYVKVQIDDGDYFWVAVDVNRTFTNTHTY
ncbi:MAG: hypothetical protein NC355_05145 [Blautia sp.]|nr:hypothetical protein [Blautia sp.]